MALRRDWRHVPFTPVGAIRVRFGVPRPMGARVLTESEMSDRDWADDYSHSKGELIEALVASIRARDRLAEWECPNFRWCPGHDICSNEECQRLAREDGEAWERASRVIADQYPHSKEKGAP